jgi:hypothetical protein
MTERAHPGRDASYTVGAPAPVGHRQAAAGPRPARRPGPHDRAASRRRLRHRRERAAGSRPWRRRADVTGIDVTPTVIARVCAKSSERGLAARSEVTDVLDLGRLSLDRPSRAVGRQERP